MKYLGDVIVVEIVAKEKESKGGIYIPETVEGSYTLPVNAKVVAIGSEVKSKDICMGDIVLVPNQLGTRIEIKGKQLRVYDYDDVIAILK